jgi:hypothetical protein
VIRRCALSALLLYALVAAPAEAGKRPLVTAVAESAVEGAD